MNDDLIERLESRASEMPGEVADRENAADGHGWPYGTATAKDYAEHPDVLLMKEAAATIRDLRAKLDEAREIMRAVFYKLDDQPDAPGHGHLIAGVWDNNSSNGDLAGKPCDWCATWERFTTLARIGDA